MGWGRRRPQGGVEDPHRLGVRRPRDGDAHLVGCATPDQKYHNRSFLTLTKSRFKMSYRNVLKTLEY